MNLNQLWLSLALGVSVAALPAPTSDVSTPLFDVNCGLRTDYRYEGKEIANGVYAPQLAGDRILVLMGPGVDATVLYIIPEGATCSITPHNKENNNNNDGQD